jgi:NADH-quinone oxidoreductase subunit J
LVGLIVLIELIMVVGGWAISSEAPRLIAEKVPEGITNTEALGRVLYTDYLLFFQLAGMVLLVAMIGAIVLTLRHKENVKRQSIPDQVARSKAAGLSIRQVKSGQGI